jgi:hypothetical protein
MGSRDRPRLRWYSRIFSIASTSRRTIQIPGDDKVTNEEKPLTRWTIPYTSITIEKVKDGPRASEFLITAETVDKLHASPGAHGAAAGTARSAQTGRPVGVEAVAPDRARTSQLSPLSPVVSCRSHSGGKTKI